MQRGFGALRARVRWNQDVVDVTLALGLAAVALLVAGLRNVSGPLTAVAAGPLTPVSAILILAQTLPLAVRRRYPVPVLIVAGVGIGLYSALGYAESGGNYGVLVALYTVAANSTRRTATLAAVLTALGILLTFENYMQHDPHVAGQLLLVYTEYAVAWVVGTYLQGHRQDVLALQERAARLEREREERARLAVAEERARIARELHDVVAHHVSVMVVQAGAARRVAATDPPAAREAMAAVESAGRTALTEMRRMLEVLRADEPDLQPEPSLARVESLVARVRAAGLPVELQVEGERPAVPAGPDLAAYRIIQEALTNVVKHAGKASASVRIAYTPDRVEVEVTDDGRGAAAHLDAEPGGRGLVGMRERALLYGGTLEAGPRPSGGYRVHAAFPIEPPPPALEQPEMRAQHAKGTRRRSGGRIASLEVPLEERFRRTDEVFADPTTQRQIRVWFDAASGERRYRLDEAEAASST
ncbi:MAG: sensor histidine kinase [Candidatus Limnocylindrales bacterium]